MITRIILDEHTRYAGFWRRFAASLIDTLMLIPLLAIVFYFIHGPADFTDPMSFNTRGPSNWLGELISMAVVIFFWVRFLGTPGKLLLDCRVVDAKTGKPLSAARAVLRYIGYYVSMLPLMLGFLWIIWDKRKQGFHDKIAGSVVVIYDEASRTLEDITAEFDKGLR